MSTSAGVTSAATKAIPTTLPGPAPGNSSMYVTSRQGPPADETNRRALEQRAGKDAAKLLLESVPSDAAIHIDGVVVGRTPLLLIVAPGNHKVEMRGPREEFGEREVALSPNDTEELLLQLKLRYPVAISVNPRRAPSFPGFDTAGTTVLPANLSGPAKDGVPMGLTSPPIEETNRKALEGRAGKDAAKLELQSVPSGALTYIDGTYVGHTPMTLVVPPGKYRIKMDGQREEFGERLVGVLPDETQQLTLTLALRYPARVTVR